MWVSIAEFQIIALSNAINIGSSSARYFLNQTVDLRPTPVETEIGNIDCSDSVEHENPSEWSIPSMLNA